MLNACRGTRVNAAPVPYWGGGAPLVEEPPPGSTATAAELAAAAQEEAAAQRLLALVFEGTSQLTGATDGSRRVVRVLTCGAAAAVAAEPELFAGATDADGVTAVHGCALNGYLATLRVLVEEGGADPYVETCDGLDASEIALRRGHVDIVEYLDTAHEVVAKIQAEKQAESDRQAHAEATRLEEAARRKQQHAERLVAEESARQTKAEVVRTAMKKAQVEAEKEAEKDAADTLTHKTVWRTVQIEVDPKRGLGFYPRNAQTTR